MFNVNSNTNRQTAINESKSRLLAASVLFASIASILAIPSSAQAACATYYVSTTGKDWNLGTINSPFLSIHNAAKKLAPCDTLYVRGGIYKQTAITLINNGTESQPVKILAYPGELPILDGSGMNIGQWVSFINLDGQYIKISGFEVRNGGTGVNVAGHHNTVSKFNVHHTINNGILAKGDYSIVEDSKVSWSCMNHYYYLTGQPNGLDGWASGLSAARDTVDGITQHAILRRNTVTENWGEGLSAYEADGIIMEDNIVYNKWALNVYISDARNVILRNNMIYNTPNSKIDEIGARFPDRFASNLVLADERPDKPRSTNNIVVNNMILNGDISAFSWSIPTDGGLYNAVIANNTVIDGNIRTGSKNLGSVIKNNIFFTSKAGFSLATVPSRTGLSLSSNVWWPATPSNASGVGDVVGDPQVVRTGSTNSGELAKGYFAVAPTSPAIGKGAYVSGITDDYAISSVGASVNIGSYATQVAPFQYVPALVVK